MNREDLKRERAAREAEARVFHGRRHFAGIALKVIMASPHHGPYGEPAYRKIAVGLAFDWADAMLAEEKARYGS